jgi:hypothetical protein
MQSRKNAVRLINVLDINNNENESDSFLLYNLLIAHQQPYFHPNQIYYLDNTPIKLSHSLKRTDPFFDNPNLKGSIYFEVGKDEGQLYQFALGLCYYEAPSSPEEKCEPISAGTIMVGYNRLIELESALYKAEPAFPSPIRIDFENMLVDDLQLTSSYYGYANRLARRIAFYILKMEEAKAWGKQRFTMQAFHDPAPPALLINFIPSTHAIEYFSKDYCYPFQGHLIKFEHTFIKRFRPNKLDQCYDFLARLPMEEGAESSIYRVVGMFPKKPPRPASKPAYTARLYKVSPTADLEPEYFRSQEFASYLHVKNGHHHFFSQRYCGNDLVIYYKKELLPLVASKETLSKYILTVLKLSALAFESLASIMKGKPHGDIKPENLLMSPQGQVLLIDFEGKGKFTPLYASPERLLNDTITEKSDVFSLIRSLVVLWGDKHPIWRNHDSSDPVSLINIKGFILRNNKTQLLSFFKANLDRWQADRYLTRDEKNKLYDLFVKAHEFNPKRRPTAQALANDFKDLHVMYAKNHDMEELSQQDEASQNCMKAGL